MTRAMHTITEFNCWHITPNRAGDQILCDTNHPDLGLFLIDSATGARTLTVAGIAGASGVGATMARMSAAICGSTSAAVRSK